jgi:thiol-disulfide isomerase/thioredoxin
MKYIITAFIALSFSFTAFAQTNTQEPEAPYLKDKKAPLFTMTSITGAEVSQKQIPSKYKFVCYIIFSPDCSHCEHEAGELNKYADKLTDVFFIWNSYRDMDTIKKFADKFSLAGKPNILIGRDPSFVLSSFFRPRMTPFVAIYKNGQFVQAYPQGSNVFELIKIIERN